jgi:hypothetical protein
MSVVADGRLPGGVSRARAVWVLVRHSPGSALLGLFLLAIVVALVVARGFVLTAIVAGVVVALMATSSSSRRPPGVVVTAASQPELADLVAGVVRQTGVRAPHLVVLIGGARLRVQTDWRGRRTVYIGRSLVECVDAVGIRVMVGHGLSVLDYRWPGLVGELVGRYDQHRDNERRRRPYAEVGAAVHQRADAVAAMVAGGADRAAAELARIDGAEMAFLMFRFSLPFGGRLRARRPQLVLDLDDGWRLTLAAGQADAIGFEFTEDLARQHPGLAAEILGRDGQPSDLARATDPVRIAPVDERQRRELVRQAMGIPPGQAVRWTTYADAPPSWWVRRADTDTDGIRREVTRVLGRSPVDEAETVEVLLARLDEVFPELGSDDEPMADEVPPAVAYQVERALLHRGWRLAHPAVRFDLLGPDGDRLDAGTVVTGTRTRPDLSRFRELLARWPVRQKAEIDSVARSRRE